MTIQINLFYLFVFLLCCALIAGIQSSVSSKYFSCSGSEQPGVVKGVPVYGRWIATGCISRPLPTPKPFYHFIILQFCAWFLSTLKQYAHLQYSDLMLFLDCCSHSIFFAVEQFSFPFKIGKIFSVVSETIFSIVKVVLSDLVVVLWSYLHV